MSSGLDLGPVFDVAAGALAAALRTGGTVVDLSRPSTVTTVDPDTTVAVPATSTALATGVAAIIVQNAPGGEERVYPGAAPAQDSRWRIILPPEHVDLRRGDAITCTASRDGRLVGGVFEVTVMLDNTAGVARTALARRVPDGGQT